MADDLTNLLTRRSNILNELAALSSSTPGGKPNVQGGGAGTVDHVGYKKSLYEELELLNRQIDMIQGPWEVPLEGRPA